MGMFIFCLFDHPTNSLDFSPNMPPHVCDADVPLCLSAFNANNPVVQYTTVVGHCIQSFGFSKRLPESAKSSADMCHHPSRYSDAYASILENSSQVSPSQREDTIRIC